MNMSTMSKLNIAICIGTYKRPTYLEKLLISISDIRFQKVVDPKISIYIVDNDYKCTAKPIADKYKNILPYPIKYSVEMRRGIPYVRNKLVRLANQSDFIVFIDDDEIVTSRWLDELIHIQMELKVLLR